MRRNLEAIQFIRIGRLGTDNPDIHVPGARDIDKLTGVVHENPSRNFVPFLSASFLLNGTTDNRLIAELAGNDDSWSDRANLQTRF